LTTIADRVTYIKIYRDILEVAPWDIIDPDLGAVSSAARSGSSGPGHAVGAFVKAAGVWIAAT
jgi:hypothetical protein